MGIALCRKISFGNVQQSLAEIGDLNGPARPSEQFNTIAFFERADVAGKRGLGESESYCGFGKVAVRGNNVKGS